MEDVNSVKNDFNKIPQMEEPKAFEIEIGGCVDVRENWISADDFADKFIHWIEENHWYFGGGFKEVKEEEELEG